MSEEQTTGQPLSFVGGTLHSTTIHSILNFFEPPANAIHASLKDHLSYKPVDYSILLVFLTAVSLFSIAYNLRQFYIDQRRNRSSTQEVPVPAVKRGRGRSPTPVAASVKAPRSPRRPSPARVTHADLFIEQNAGETLVSTPRQRKPVSNYAP